MSGSRTVSLMILGIVALGCYTGYTATYRIGEIDRRARFVDLDAEIEQALASLGFERQRNDLPDTVWFIKRGAGPSGSAPGLEGSDALMTVAVDMESLWISIRDTTYVTETAFNRLVRRTIEELLRSHYGISDPVFKRQLDLFN